MAHKVTDQFLVTYLLDAVARLRKNIDPVATKLVVLEERLATSDKLGLSNKEREELYQQIRALVQPAYDLHFAIKAPGGSH